MGWVMREVGRHDFGGIQEEESKSKIDISQSHHLLYKNFLAWCWCKLIQASWQIYFGTHQISSVVWWNSEPISKMQ